MIYVAAIPTFSQPNFKLILGMIGFQNRLSGKHLSWVQLSSYVYFLNTRIFTRLSGGLKTRWKKTEKRKLGIDIWNFMLVDWSSQKIIRSHLCFWNVVKTKHCVSSLHITKQTDLHNFSWYRFVRMKINLAFLAQHNSSLQIF